MADTKQDRDSQYVNDEIDSGDQPYRRHDDITETPEEQLYE